jgi:hypothetical protein
MDGIVSILSANAVFSQLPLDKKKKWYIMQITLYSKVNSNAKEIEMSNQINLKALERKAFRSTYEDGLWDIYWGLIVICMAFFVYRPATGYSPLNIILTMCTFIVAYALLWAAKKFITLPRMGQVRFGAVRKQKARTLAIILGVFVIVQGGIVLLTALSWRNPELAAKINSFLPAGSMERLMVATVGSLFVGPSLIVIAYFSDFLRGYYISILMALAVFLMILLNQPVYPVIIGGVIIVPGVVLLVQFLRKYPLHREAGHE